MISPMSKGMLTRFLKTPKTGECWSLIDNMWAEQFPEGAEGYNLYKEVSTVVMENAPGLHPEFIKRYAKLLTAEGITDGQFGGQDNFEKAMLQVVKEAKEERENKPGFFARLFKK